MKPGGHHRRGTEKGWPVTIFLDGERRWLKIKRRGRLDRRVIRRREGDRNGRNGQVKESHR
jgi:hypothetical protein